jgi:hypothetical protein
VWRGRHGFVCRVDFPPHRRIVVHMTQTSHQLALATSDDATTFGYSPFCSCGWNDKWYRVADFGGSYDEAETAAVEAGTEHICDVA